MALNVVVIDWNLHLQGIAVVVGVADVIVVVKQLTIFECSNSIFYWSLQIRCIFSWNSFNLYFYFSANVISCKWTNNCARRLTLSFKFVLFLKNLLEGVGGLSHGQLREIEIRWRGGWGHWWTTFWPWFFKTISFIKNYHFLTVFSFSLAFLFYLSLCFCFLHSVCRMQRSDRRSSDTQS